MTERQSAWMSKSQNGGLDQWQQCRVLTGSAVKGLIPAKQLHDIVDAQWRDNQRSEKVETDQLMRHNDRVNVDSTLSGCSSGIRTLVPLTTSDRPR